MTLDRVAELVDQHGCQISDLLILFIIEHGYIASFKDNVLAAVFRGGQCFFRLCCHRFAGHDFNCRRICRSCILYSIVFCFFGLDYFCMNRRNFCIMNSHFIEETITVNIRCHRGKSSIGERNIPVAFNNFTVRYSFAGQLNTGISNCNCRCLSGELCVKFLFRRYRCFCTARSTVVSRNRCRVPLRHILS